jgi:hypothetical protein
MSRAAIMLIVYQFIFCFTALAAIFGITQMQTERGFP